MRHPNPLADLKALIDEPCTAECLDVDNSRRLSDDEVHELLSQQSGVNTVADFQKLSKEQQETIIIELRTEGASVRQIVSHTGYTTKRVRTITDK